MPTGYFTALPYTGFTCTEIPSKVIHLTLSLLFGYTGDIVAIGDGKVGDKIQDFYLQPGQTVLYSKFGIGVTDLFIQGEQHCLIKEEDCIGVLPNTGATANDIPKLKPNGDRILLKVSESLCKTLQGIFYLESTPITLSQDLMNWQTQVTIFVGACSGRDPSFYIDHITQSWRSGLLLSCPSRPSRA